MYKSIIITLIGVIALLHSSTALAAPDQYPGDTSIYGSATVLDPNVLIIIDTSLSMSMNPKVQGEDYDKNRTYDVVSVCGTYHNEACQTNYVYKVTTSGHGSTTYSYLNVIGNIDDECAGRNPRAELLENGTYQGRTLNSNGSCGSSGISKYYYGNYINWLKTAAVDRYKIDVVKSVVDKLIQNTPNVRFGVMTYFTGGNKGGTFLKDVPSGATTNYTTTIKDMDEIFEGTMDNRTALRKVVQTISASGYTPLSTTLYEAGQYFRGAAPAFGATIGAESGTYVSPATPYCRKNYVVFLTDGMPTIDNYTSTAGSYSDSKLIPWNDPGVNFLKNSLVTMGTTGSPAVNTSDVDGDGSNPGMNDTGNGSTMRCYGTDGMNPTDTVVSCCQDSWGNPVSCTDTSRRQLFYDFSHALPDVARYLYTVLGPTQNIVTYMIGFGSDLSSTAAVNLLNKTVDSSHGHGAFYQASNQTNLTETFDSIISNILAVNTSYVAPVVPVSPENRTYASNRIYMGYFKPVDNQASWLGNLKKYGIDINSDVVDENGDIATYIDMNGDGTDDNTGTENVANGAFIPTARSYWSSAVDGGEVAAGGAGDLLQDRANINTSRTIYTTASTAPSANATLYQLNDSTHITPALLNVADAAAATKLVNFIYGLDVFGANPTANKSWVMGDVMHSRPLVVNYVNYKFCDTALGDDCSRTAPTVPTHNEENCSVNQSMIYVGGNDGMLHAVRDCDGGEEWAFVPPDTLPNLQYLNGNNHQYYADSTSVSYIYDADNDGNIESGDSVILIFGERRGGGTNISADGSYYALDVTDRTSPTFLWKISNADTGFSELGETWSEPKIVRMRIGAEKKIVAFFGAGYDNLNEDMRYGNTQSFSGGTVVDNGDTGDTGVSASGSPATPQHGRGIFAVEIATLSGTGEPSFTNSGQKIWSYTNGTCTTTSTAKCDTGVNFSFPGEITSIDTWGTGFTDVLYTADTGGNLWRFNVGSTDRTSWTGTKIFSANPGYPDQTLDNDDNGRKVFYKPSVLTEVGYRMIFFGTGDREHPLNTSVVDRIYAIKDPIVSPISTTLKEENLVDVTEDQLQTLNSATQQTDINTLLATLYSSTAGGWFIRLSTNSGEKVLAAPTVFNKVLYITTYSPEALVVDVCAGGNLGTSRLYALNYKTGEAVLNYNTGNDVGAAPNARAKHAGGGLLDATDRVKTTGSGIPSGLVILITSGGDTKAFTGIGGAITSDNPPPGGSLVPLYWRQK